MSSSSPSTSIAIQTHLAGAGAGASELTDLPNTPLIRSPDHPAARRPSTSIAMAMASTSPPSTIVDKTLSSTANLAKLLPTGTVLAFQTLSPSFTDKGTCYTSNKYITAVLILLCSLSCAFFSATDTFVSGAGDGKTYYGVATLRGFFVINYSGADDEDRDNSLGDLRRLRLRAIDAIHAFFSVLLFLTVAFSDAGVQLCLFPSAGPNGKELLVNLPLGAGFFSVIVFLVFPTTRKSIGFADSTPSP